MALVKTKARTASKKPVAKKPAAKAVATKKAAPTVKKPAAKAPMTKAERMKAMHAARKAGGAKKGASPAKRKPAIVHSPPADFKAFFLDLTFRTGADGLMSPKIKLERNQARWDSTDEKKRSNMFEYDTLTAAAFISRFSGKLFSVNPNFKNAKAGTGIEARKRLMPNTTYKVVLRVLSTANKNSKAGEPILGCRVAHLARYEKNPTTGKSKVVWLDNAAKYGKDPDRRRIRAAGKFCAGAFTECLLPPSRSRRSKAESED